MAMRQMTQFSMVSSNWDDSFGSRHLPSAIYALAGTARGETAACSHPRRYTFTRPGSRAGGHAHGGTRARLEPYSGRAVRCGHGKIYAHKSQSLQLRTRQLLYVIVFRCGGGGHNSAPAQLRTRQLLYAIVFRCGGGSHNSACRRREQLCNVHLQLGQLPVV